MAEIQVRQASVDDASGIAEVHVRSWQAAYRGLIPDEILDGLSIDDRAARWGRILTAGRPGESNMVATLDGRVVAFASWGPGRDEDLDGAGELYAIYALADVWGTGCGRALMGPATDALRAGYRLATLWVLRGNERGRRFYEAAGWAPDGGTKLEDRGAFTLDELRYRITF